MKTMISCLLSVVLLGGCGIEEGIKRNDERYLKPGALDLPLTNVYDTYQYKFLDKYRITHQWPHTAGTCKYRAVIKDDPHGGRYFPVRDIYEVDGHTWQAGTKTFEEVKRTRYVHPTYPTPPPTFDEYAYSHSFDRYVRSVKIMNPVYGKVKGVRQKIGEEEIEGGLQSLCFESWYATSHSLVMRLHKQDQNTWKAQWTQFNPKGKWSEQRVGGNLWAVQETPEQELSPRAPGAAGGWFQSWMLPIGDTGYTITLQLGASQESLQYPEAHARMKASFRHLIESVKIEPLQP